jgi:urea transport system ATP-binding protein
MIEIAGLNQFYHESHTLRDVTLSIPSGLITCLMGRNGVGKTTLLDCIMGLLPVRSGTINYNGVALEGCTAEYRPRHGVGYVPQGRMIFPQLTVAENLAIGLPASQPRQRRVPDSIYELFPVLRAMAGRRGGDLSGGQQQQLAIGRALVLNPEVLILDEPCEGIQPNVVAQIGEVILHLNKTMNLTVLLVEQKLPFARRVADNFAIMDRGAIAANGSMDDLNENLIDEYLRI